VTVGQLAVKRGATTSSIAEMYLTRLRRAQRRDVDINIESPQRSRRRDLYDIAIAEMSSNTNQLLAQDRVQRVARLQARQARWNGRAQRNRAAQHAQQLAFAAQNPGIHPGLVFQNVGVHWNPNPHGHFQPSIQHPGFQHPVFQVPPHMNTAIFGAYRPNPAIQHVPAIQNVPAVNTAVPAQVRPASSPTISLLLTLLSADH
jgi:hypothetical protein